VYNFQTYVIHRKAYRNYDQGDFKFELEVVDVATVSTRFTLKAVLQCCLQCEDRSTLRTHPEILY